MTCEEKRQISIVSACLQDHMILCSHPHKPSYIVYIEKYRTVETRQLIMAYRALLDEILKRTKPNCVRLQKYSLDLNILHSRLLGLRLNRTEISFCSSLTYIFKYVNNCSAFYCY